jgi:hypothetical protein
VPGGAHRVVGHFFPGRDLMASGIPVVSGAGNVQAVTGPVTLVGLMVRESAATAAAATFVLRDGTTVTDPIRAVIKLAASDFRSISLPAVSFTTGVFVHREVGTTELVLYSL